MIAGDHDSPRAVETGCILRLFTPLGMRRSNFTVAAMRADLNHSEAYELNTRREVVKVEHEPLDTMGPTGSIYSSVDEMASYARMMLAGGSF